MITNVLKDSSGWWRGDYGGKRHHWFPSNYVEEIQETHGDSFVCEVKYMSFLVN